MLPYSKYAVNIVTRFANVNVNKVENFYGIVLIPLACSVRYTFIIGSFRVRSTNGLRVTPPISMKFGTLADNA